MYQHTLSELSKLLHSKKISSVELTQSYLNRIETTKALNAVLAINPEVSLAQAHQADLRLRQADPDPLCGIPLLHKDVFVTREWPSTAGSRMLANYYSPFNATVVEQFYQAGMVCLGKTNMDEFAMGSSSEHSYFGNTRNPWHLDYVPGGSSGGSAAAVAARLAPAATGTDTGGSIRQPAALCGITGIKPTYGLVSRFGMIAFASSLDQAGPMALTAEDCALLLNVMATFDAQDSTAVHHPREDYTRFLKQPLAGATATQPLLGLRIGLPREYFGPGLADDVRLAIEQALQRLRVLGATTIEVNLPKTELSIPVYYLIAPAEASSNLARFDGVRYGHRAAQYQNLQEMYMKTRAEGFGWEVKRRILVGTYILSHGYYDAYYLQAQKIRRMIADDFQQAFQQCDVLMGPVTPTTAWKLGEKTTDPLQMYLADIYTLSTSLAGLPGMSFPCGFGKNGLPVGLQMIGNHFDEARMLQIADAFQQVTDWHQRQPEHLESAQLSAFGAEKNSNFSSKVERAGK
jgi:aspartyl-tRNA(Asn)/glutamyl-tRNA(Gln) amidotransferase subunit A